MPFSPSVKARLFIRSARICALCYKQCGANIEAAHIIAEAKGGSNEDENGILACFDCHQEIGAYDDEHPRGNKFTPEELRQRREQLFGLVESGSIQAQIIALRTHGQGVGHAHPTSAAVAANAKAVQITASAEARALFGEISSGPRTSEALPRKLKLLSETDRAWILDRLLDGFDKGSVIDIIIAMVAGESVGQSRLVLLEQLLRKVTLSTAWENERAELQEELHDATEPTGFTGMSDAVPIILHKDESVFLVANGAALVEPKRLPGNWVGGYSGVSVRVMKGISYHVGSTHGHYVPGPEVPAPIAIGSATVTDQRVVFQSDNQAREWTFAKLLGYQHDPTKPLTYFQVSNRQKVSGIGYDVASSRKWRFRLSLAIAHFRGEVPLLLDHLKKETQEHEAAKPRAPMSSLAAGS